MPTKNDPQVQDKQNDPPPSKGTNEPWKRPGQTLRTQTNQSRQSPTLKSGTNHQRTETWLDAPDDYQQRLIASTS